MPLLALAAAVSLAAGCKPVTDPGTSPTPGSTGGGVANGRAVSPLDNPDGTKPGLASITSAADKSAARALIDQLPTHGTGSKSGYTRDQFSQAWTDSATGDPLAGNGCDTRDDVLARDGESVQFASGSHCTVSSMTLANPYKGDSIQWTKSKATAIQIDHVLPLSYSWQMGASGWSKAQRTQLANDTLNLLAVDGSDNEAKGDSGPSEWLPPHQDIRCSYVVRFAQVALKYKLAVTQADKSAMLEQCGG
jgi:hypothetical protein